MHFCSVRHIRTRKERASWAFENGVNQMASRLTGQTLVDRVCRRLDWEIDERHDCIYGLYFNGDHLVKRRTVHVAYNEGDAVMSFFCDSVARFTGDALPDSLLPSLLLRNWEVTIGAWHAKVEDGEVRLGLRYTALSQGVDATTFHMICEGMVKQVAEVEHLLHGKGLL